MGIDQHTLQVGTWDRQADTLVSADGDQNRGKSFIEKVVQIVDLRVQAQVNTQVKDILNLAFDNLGGQAVFRHAQAQHAASNGHGFKNRHRVACSDDILGSWHADWSCADDCDSLVKVLDLDLINRLAWRGVDFIGDEEFQGADIDWLIDLAAIAGRFTAGVEAAPTEPGEGSAH